MGKADETYIIPMNNSLSVTLDRFYTETKVTFDPDFTEDCLILNGNEVNAKEKEKIQKLYEYSERFGWKSFACTN